MRCKHLKFSTAILFLTLFFWGNQARSQTYFPPITGNQWDTFAPQRFNYCQESIDSLYGLLEQSNSKAFILLKNGRIVLEYYVGSFKQDSIWYWASAGKTLTAALIGIAADKSLLSLTDKSSDYLGLGWTSLKPAQEDSIKIWHQLTMTTGLNDRGDLDCTEPSCLTYLAPAGSRWSYHNAPYTKLDGVIESASGQGLNMFLSQELSKYTGITGLYVKVGDNNVFFSKARSMARFGHLLLNQGEWNGKQVISKSYVDSMITSSQSLNPAYGYLTWLNGKDRFMIPQSQIRFPGSIMQDAPVDAYAALGKNGQMIQVVPSEDLVWIRMGDNPEVNNPLVSVTYANDLWYYVRNLSCETTNTNLKQKGNMVWPNPIVVGAELPVREGIMVSVTGKVTPFSDFRLPDCLVPGLYQLIWSNGTRRLVVVNR